jgi:small-conductance mechanosensitive channel
MLADMTSRKSFLQTQLHGLQRELRNDIAQAANYERQNKPIPAMLKKSITDNKKNVFEAQQNIEAITERQQQVTQQYDGIIRRLKTM